MADLDDLLDDIEIEGGGEIAPTPRVINVEEELQSPNYQAWIEAVSNVPEHVRSRWSAYLVRDSHIEVGQSLNTSDSYRSWDGQPPNHVSVSKFLQEAVRNACMKCSFDERKTTTLLSLTNPVEPGPGKTLTAAYSKQILKDLKKSYSSDPNFDPKRFPHLATFE
jgi:hypothetical protein